MFYTSKSNRLWVFLITLVGSTALLGLIGCNASAPSPTAVSSTPATRATPVASRPSPLTPAAVPSDTPLPATAIPLLPTPTSVATVLPGATSTRTPRPDAIASPRLVVLATGLASPDDLVLAPDGSIYFTDVGDGTVKRLDRNGQVSLILSKLPEPEGLAFLPDGSLLIAEQGSNRIAQYDFASKRLSIWLQLQNRTGKDGVDGIAFDPRDQTVLVPDSPNGTLLRVTLDKKITRLASGIARPTGVAVEPDGALLVPDEYGNALLRIRPGSTPLTQVVARLPVADDVVVAADGSIYVNTLNEGAIHRIDLQTGGDTIFYRGLSNPQGIVLDQDGNLVIADAGNHRLVRLVLN